MNLISFATALALCSSLLSGLCVANASTLSSAKSNYKNSTFSSASKKSAEEFPTITNEAEYADLVKKREEINQAGSAKSTTIHTSRYSTASSESSSTSFSRANKK